MDSRARGRRACANRILMDVKMYRRVLVGVRAKGARNDVVRIEHGCFEEIK